MNLTFAIAAILVLGALIGLFSNPVGLLLLCIVAVVGTFLYLIFMPKSR